MSRPDPSVGHALLDEQHRILRARLEALEERFSAGDRDGVLSALDALREEVLVHFASEDALMEAQAYPERSAHRASHGLFQQDLERLKGELCSRGLDESTGEAVRRRVPEWFDFHVRTNDAPLAQYLARRTAAGLVAAALRRARDP